MSYIEDKYLKKIHEIFAYLSNLDEDLTELISQKSLKAVDDIARMCAEVNKNINLILKKYYSEIKGIDDKLQIKSNLKFYYDLIDKLTDLVRNVEFFKKIDDKYYIALIEFIEDKRKLISGKYKQICTQELTAFYDQNSRQNLEKILASKLEKRNREFFTFGSLEEELKKIAKIAGADEVTIFPAELMGEKLDLIQNPKSTINYSILSRDEETLKAIGRELKEFLTSKGYEAAILLIELTDLSSEKEALIGSIITSANLIPND